MYADQKTIYTAVLIISLISFSYPRAFAFIGGPIETALKNYESCNEHKAVPTNQFISLFGTNALDLYKTPQSLLSIL
jgi:hypothetical protein